MPPSLHKFLEHGYQVADYLDLPIGLYSEEAQEACSKLVRKARLDHTAKEKHNGKSGALSSYEIRSNHLISVFQKT